MFAVFEYYPLDLKAFLQRFDTYLSPTVLLRLALYILDALLFLESQNIAHWDIKLDNFMVTACGVICLADLGEALCNLVASRKFRLHCNFASGNQVHRAPEVLNALVKLLSATETDIDLSGQAVFEAAMVIGTMLLRRLPLRGYPERYQVREDAGMRIRYAPADVCALTEVEATCLRASGIQLAAVDLIRAGLHPDSSKRPTLSAFRDWLVQCLEPCVAGVGRSLVRLVLDVAHCEFFLMYLNASSVLAICVR